MEDEKQRNEMIPMPETLLQSKGRIPSPWSFFCRSQCKAGFFIDKQLTNSGHLTRVNQLQEALKMRDSQGGKSKIHSCSDEKVKLCRLGRSSPITAHINGFEIICTCS